MFVNLRTLAIALAVAATVIRAADDPAAPAGNGTSADAPAAPGNGTSADAPAAPNNGTSAGDAPNNGTSADAPNNGTSSADAPQPSGGPTGSNSRRALQACEWSCPWRARELVEFEMGGAFTCMYADAVTCVYQKTTGVLTRNDAEGECPNAATALTAGCVPGQSTNGGLLRPVAPRDRKTRRTSRDIQRSAMKRRNML